MELPEAVTTTEALIAEAATAEGLAEAAIAAGAEAAIAVGLVAVTAEAIIEAPQDGLSVQAHARSDCEDRLTGDGPVWPPSPPHRRGRAPGTVPAASPRPSN